MPDSQTSPSERSMDWRMAALLGCLAVLIALGLSMLATFQRTQPQSENLHVAAIHLPEDIPKLLARGDDINQQDADGNTPLHFAVARRLYDVAEVLLAAGASTEAENNYGSKPADSGWGNKRMAALFESAGASSPTE